MNNKLFILFFILFAFLFGSVTAQNKVKQKDKNEAKSIVTVKVDSSKVKLRNIITDIDSINSNLTLKTFKKNAHASYYHNKFNGRRTASGKKFDNNGYTAAHKKFPFGTKLKVTNEDTGKSVIVEVTDRGPFSKAREIDLSRRAFMEITSNKNSGVVIVTIEEVINPK